MKNAQKRMMSFLLVMTVLFGLGCPAFASEVTTANSWMQDFTGYAADTVPDGFDDTTATQFGNKAAFITAVGSGGVYGKDASDIAYTMKSAGQTGTALDGKKDTYELRRQISKGAGGGTTGLAETDFFHFSFEYATDNYDAQYGAWLSAYIDKKNVNMNDRTALFAVNGPQKTITAFGTDLVADYPIEKWMKFDYLFYNHSGAAYVDVYVDGVKKADAVALTDYFGAGMITGINRIYFSVATAASGGNYLPGNIYLDNFYHAQLTARPEIEPPAPTITLTHTDPSVVVDQAQKTVTIPDKMDADAFLKGFGGENVKSVAVLDKAGNPQTGSVTTGIVRVTGNDDSTLDYLLIDLSAVVSITPAEGSEYMVDGEGMLIFIPAAATKEAFLKNLVLKNCTFGGLYADKDCTEAVAEDSVAEGRFVQFLDAADHTPVVYEIFYSTSILGIKSASYPYDDQNRTISVMAGTQVSAFLNGITLYPGHRGVLLDASENPLSENDLIQGCKNLTYRILFGGQTLDYRLLCEYLYEPFDQFQGISLTGNNEMFGRYEYRTTTTGSSAAGVTLDGENVLLMHSVRGSDGDTIRIKGMTQEDTGTKFVLTLDMMTTSKDALNSLVAVYTNTSGTANNYYNLIDFKPDGNVYAFSKNLGSYQENTWSRIAIVADISARKGQIYLNGKLAFDGTLPLVSALRSFNELIIKAGHNGGERSTWVDNFAYYQITSTSAFDASSMSSELANQSGYEILQPDGSLSGYGTATAAELYSMLSVAAGADMQLYSGETPVDAAEKVLPGMELLVTSPDGHYTTTYPVKEAVRYVLKVHIDGTEAAYLVGGSEVSAVAEVYAAVSTEFSLAAKYKAGTDGYTEVLGEPVTVSGAKTLKLVIDGFSPKNVPGEEVAVDLLSNGTVLSSVLLPYSGDRTYQSEILQAKDGAKAIVTFITDDGLPNSLTKYNSYLSASGIKGTSAIPASTAQKDPAFYRGLFGQGNIDVASHSYNHVKLDGSQNDDFRFNETAGSRTALKALFPDQEVMCFIPSDNSMDSKSAELVMQNYWSARQGTRGFNTLDPKEGSSAGQWYNLYIQAAGDDSNPLTQLQTMNGYVDTAIAQGKWLIEMWHGIGEGGYQEASESYAQSHIAYLGEKQASGEAWVASFAEATKYIRERQFTQIEDFTIDGVRTVRLNLEIPDKNEAYAKYDVSFDAPLSVKSEVPPEWNYVKITQGSKVQGCEAFMENGKYYIIYDAVPNSEAVVLEQVDQLPQVSVEKLVLSSTGALSQQEDATSPVEFRLSVTPAANADTSGIEWYVNNVKQSVPAGSLTFTYQPTLSNLYNVYAVDSKSGVKSGTVSISVAPTAKPGILFRDSFNLQTGALVSTGADSWDRNVGDTQVYTEPDGNKTAKFHFGVGAWPALHKTTSTEEGVPIIYSGRIKIQNGTLDGQPLLPRHYLEIRNADETLGSNNDFRKVILKISTDEISSNGITKPGVKNGEWVYYQVTVTPAAKGVPSRIVAMVYGPGVVDSAGQETVIIMESELLMDVIWYNGETRQDTVKMVFNNENPSSLSGTSDACVYFDDVLIRNPLFEISGITPDFMATGMEMAGSATVTVQNYSGTDAHAAVILAVYDAQGNLLHSQIKPQAQLATGSENLLFENIQFESQTDTLKIRAFLWESLDNMVPMCASQSAEILPE